MDKKKFLLFIPKETVEMAKEMNFSEKKLCKSLSSRRAGADKNTDLTQNGLIENYLFSKNSARNS